MRVDVLDFDHTVYRGDASVDFWRHCLRARPGLLVWLPVQALAVLLMHLRVLSPERGKSGFFVFLRQVGDAQAEVARFWSSHEDRLEPWFRPREHDLPMVIISASPEFIIGPICASRGVAHWIGTRVNPRTGRVLGLNCKHQEKVDRLRALLPEVRVRRMSSDSRRDDGPLFGLAQERVWVRNGVRTRWREEG